MNTLSVSSNSIISSSNKVQNNGKSAKLAKNDPILNKTADLVQIPIQSYVLRPCGPLYLADTARVYYYMNGNISSFDVYSVWIKPMDVDTSRYVLGTKNAVYSLPATVKDLDLATHNLHVVQNNNTDTTVNINIMPGDTRYVTYIQEMLNDIDYTWHPLGPGYSHPAGDIPEMQRPYEFMQCALTKVGITAPAKKLPDNTGGIDIYRTSSGEIKISFDANGNKNPSVRIFNVTGKLVSNIACKGTDLEKNMTATWNASKAATGLYECVIESGKSIIEKKILIVK